LSKPLPNPSLETYNTTPPWCPHHPSKEPVQPATRFYAPIHRLPANQLSDNSPPPWPTTRFHTHAARHRNDRYYPNDSSDRASSTAITLTFGASPTTNTTLASANNLPAYPPSTSDSHPRILLDTTLQTPPHSINNNSRVALHSTLRYPLTAATQSTSLSKLQ
jgi:hypothetical protein